jgi:hypothetical protein
MVSVMMSCTSRSGNHDSYFPEPDSLGGWRSLTDAKRIKKQTGIDIRKLDSAILSGDYKKWRTSGSENGWLVYELFWKRRMF